MRQLRIALVRGRAAGLTVTMAVMVTAVMAASCGGHAEAREARAFPARLVPPTIGDLSISEEVSAQDAFKAAGRNSMVAMGKVFTLRRDGAVEGALEVSVLRTKYRTSDISVRRGVRSNIETGLYRWFKVDGQWVGVQELKDLKLYLWFPPDGGTFEILQVRPQFPNAKQLVTDVIRYQEGT